MGVRQKAEAVEGQKAEEQLMKEQGYSNGQGIRQKTRPLGYQGHRWKRGDFWKPGEPLSEADLKMLRPVKKYYERYGYPPSRKVMANAGALKQRFRIWKDVLLAAGVPPMNDPECQLRKQKAREWEKRVRAERIKE